MFGQKANLASFPLKFFSNLFFAASDVDDSVIYIYTIFIYQLFQKV